MLGSLGLAPAPVLHAGDVSLRILALKLRRGRQERYVTLVRHAEAGWAPAALRHDTGATWLLEDSPVELGEPDAVYSRLMDMCGPRSELGLGSEVPHWPSEIVVGLERRGIHGSGTVVFCPEYFLSLIATSSMNEVVLLPHAESRLGVAGLRRAGRVCRQAAAAYQGFERRRPAPTASPNAAFLETMQAAACADEWAWRRSAGVGRLIGEFDSGELAQLGETAAEGLEAAAGRGPVTVRFPPDEPLGLGFGPRAPSDEGGGGGGGGIGAEVGEVDAGGAAEAGGVAEGDVFARLLEPPLELSTLPFDEILAEIDRRRARGDELVLELDTAAAIRRLYAVELPATDALTALAAAAKGGGRRVSASEAAAAASTSTAGDAAGDAADEADGGDVGGAVRALLPASSFLWSEREAKLFVGDAGSLTCAHTDIVPQLELAHGLAGVKLLGIASHAATPRLRASHAGTGRVGAFGSDGDEDDDEDDDEYEYDDDDGGGDDDDGGDDDGDATRVPTDRPLGSEQSALLRDEAMSVAALRAGDLLAFSSGALHFASNGAAALSAALYHGGVTPPLLPRLRAARATGHAADGDEYGPAAVLSEIEGTFLNVE